VFTVVGQDVRQCLICEGVFTIQGAAEHANVICYPIPVQRHRPECVGGRNLFLAKVQDVLMLPRQRLPVRVSKLGQHKSELQISVVADSNLWLARRQIGAHVKNLGPRLCRASVEANVPRGCNNGASVNQFSSHPE
jgi:hypothetical protein